MSKETTIKTNADEVYKAFLELTTKEMKKALKTGITKAANQLRTATKKTLRAALPKSNVKGRFNDKLVDAVRRSKVEEDKQHEISAKVHIMGTRSTGSGTYRTRFFEKGTAPRKTSKGYNRGTIRALNFFQSANSSFQNDYSKILNDEIGKAIKKINYSKIKTK